MAGQRPGRLVAGPRPAADVEREARPGWRHHQNHAIRAEVALRRFAGLAAAGPAADAAAQPVHRAGRPGVQSGCPTGVVYLSLPAQWRGDGAADALRPRVVAARHFILAAA